MMNNLSSRYAQSLFSIAKEKGTVLTYQKEVKDIINLLEEEPKFLKLLTSSFISLEERLKTVEKTFASFDLDIVSLLKVIIRNDRGNNLIEILKEFNSMCNEDNGVLEGICYSTISLSKEQIEKLEETMSKKEKKKVELRNRIDSSLIGGVKIVIKDKVYDGSVLAKLNSLEASLLKGGL